MHEALVNHLEGLSLPRKSVVRLIDRPGMTLDIYWDVKQQNNNNIVRFVHNNISKSDVPVNQQLW